MNPLYTLQEKVIHGQKRGKALGYPTANLPLSQNIPEGIYASKIEVRGKTYIAATFIGSAQTFNEVDRKVESFIVDFDEVIYGELVTVTFFKKIRDNTKFTTVENLVKQIEIDVKNIKLFFDQTTT